MGEYLEVEPGMLLDDSDEVLLVERFDVGIVSRCFKHEIRSDATHRRFDRSFAEVGAEVVRYLIQTAPHRFPKRSAHWNESMEILVIADHPRNDQQQGQQRRGRCAPEHLAPTR